MLFHVVLMVSVGLNYILQVAFELRESQWAQRLALSLTFSPYTFQSSTLTSVTTLLPCWKLGYRVCFNLAEKLSHCRDKRGAINSTELRWRYLTALHLFVVVFMTAITFELHSTGNLYKRGCFEKVQLFCFSFA